MIELDDVEHRYGATEVLSGVSLQLETGQVGCVLGASGCGKTTLLRCIAGFERVVAGEIRAGGEILSTRERHVPPELRRIGMVFQDYALLPHLSVIRNVAFGLHALDKNLRHKRAMEMLEKVQLVELAERFPHELSGGQQQRVAIARALAPQPALLLLDEPFSNLDAGLRAQLGQEVRALLTSLGATALVVTHDHNDAYSVADVAGVMRAGRLLQWSSTYELYHRPTDRYVANFVGPGAWLAGVARANNEIELPFGSVRDASKTHFAPGTAVDVLVRPDDVVPDSASEHIAEITDRQFRGAEFLYELMLPDGQKLLSLVSSHHNHQIGENLGVRLDLQHLVAFPRRD